MRNLLAAIFILVLLTLPASADQSLTPKTHHLRYGDHAEWDNLTTTPESNRLSLTFTSAPNTTEKALRLRHRDLRHAWLISLNGKDLARIGPENDEMLISLPIPPNQLRDGNNELVITPVTPSKALHQFSDDIFIGPIDLLDSTREAYLTTATLDLSLTDADTAKPIPGRFTIVDSHGARIDIATPSSNSLAIRPGVVYTGTGRAQIHLPTGAYKIYAGRGFEWGLDSTTIELAPGQAATRALKIRREVDTTGLIASDTHIHTFTHSRHGDATLAEQMIALAGEGIELPIATDHNLHINFEEAARAANVRSFFTPVVGNELTTPHLGHFNLFPVDPNAAPIDPRLPTWDRLFAAINAQSPQAIIILNHARDTHGDFRPFDPSRHDSLTGHNRNGWSLPIHAMEVINSGATTSDPRILFRDLMGLINNGQRVAPIGSSDSHDVAKYIVGQGRTYIQCNDTKPDKIDIPAAIDSLRAGRVSASYGLLVELNPTTPPDPNQLVKPNNSTDPEFTLTVKGPSWTQADRAEIYVNGQLYKTFDIPPATSRNPNLKFTTRFTLPKPSHDVFVTALAIGPGIEAPYWPAAKPYQPTTNHWRPYVIGFTAATYLDIDGNGKFDSAYAIAQQRIATHTRDLSKLLPALESDHPSIIHQVIRLLTTGDGALTVGDIQRGAATTSKKIQSAVETYLSALK